MYVFAKQTRWHTNYMHCKSEHYRKLPGIWKGDLKKDFVTMYNHENAFLNKLFVTLLLTINPVLIIGLFRNSSHNMPKTNTIFR
uniref:Uncharacterized protein n=1 Tax=Glossina austeni TaxID=7395 RepID=A0A1A9UDP3_GLOAU